MRETGYYWVKLDGIFEIGYYSGLLWTLIETENYFEDDYFEEIDENRIIKKID